MYTWISTNGGYVYMAVNDWRQDQELVHKTFYKASGEGWGSCFKNIILSIAESYTEQHDCLKFMNECQPRRKL